MPFDYCDVLRADLPGPAGRWSGFPAHNFVGGHMDADHVPVEDLIAALTNALQREGKTWRLTIYGRVLWLSPAARVHRRRAQGAGGDGGRSR